MSLAWLTAPHRRATSEQFLGCIRLWQPWNIGMKNVLLATINALYVQL
jgi:hypothetical protein